MFHLIQSIVKKIDYTSDICKLKSFNLDMKNMY